MSVKRIVFFVLKLAFVVFLFTLIFQPQWLGFDKSLFGDVDVLKLWARLKEASTVGFNWFIGCLLLATLCKVLGIFSGVIRWELLLRGQGLYIPFVRATYTLQPDLNNAATYATFARAYKQYEDAYVKSLK